jgi:hypothetical protein
MAYGQADPAVDFIVTYGHRPAYSSLGANGWDPTVRAALGKLAKEYSPHRGNRTGKYVLNLAHHVHGLEVFKPVHGLLHVTNAGGGQGTVELRNPAKGSLLRFAHLGVLAGDYDAAARRLSLRWICGPRLDSRETGSRETGSRETGSRETGSREMGSKETCGYGDTVWSTTFTAANGRAGPGQRPARRRVTAGTRQPGRSGGGGRCLVRTEAMGVGWWC